MSETYIRNGDTEPIQVDVRETSGAGATGLTNIFVRVRRDSDGQFFDWADLTFKAAAHTQLDKLCAEIDSTNAPGLYEVVGGFDTGTVTNVVESDRYLVLAIQSPSTGQKLPAPEAFRAGRWVEDVVLTRKRNLNRRRINFAASPTVEEVFDDDGTGPILSAIVSDPGGQDVLPAVGAPSEVQKFS